MSETAEAVTTVVARTGLSAGEALASKDAYKDEAWWRWDAMIRGGAVGSKETPATCIAKAAYGEIYGWAPILSVSRVYLVDGRPCLAAEAMVGLVRERVPASEIEKVEHDAKHCIVRGRRSPEHAWHICEFNEEDAKRAGLLNKQNWQKYPKSMYWARAASMLTRELFSDVTLGAHTVEELEDGPPPRVQQMGRSGPVVVDEPTLPAATTKEIVIDESGEQVPAQLEDCPLCHGVDGEHIDPMCPERSVADEYGERPTDGDAEGPSPDAAVAQAVVAGRIPSEKKSRRAKAQKESE